MLFSYMICFSFSYIKVSTGTGALILFGTVQITMIIAGILRGERPSLATLIGTTLATAGMIYLLLPGIDAPPVFNALLMGIAGFSWAIYTLAGKKTDNPLADTMWNFVGTLPLLLIGFLVFQNRTTVPFDGAVYAVLSGSLASAMGYTIWYSALKALNSSQAATVQLSVPVLAAAAGVILLSEPYSWRMVFSGIFILGGIYLTIKNKASG
jgi:drug/metabolite transporter (DMT)-like permease